jgi:hypothetical protein
MPKWRNLVAKVRVTHIVAAVEEIRSGQRPVPRRRRARRWLLAYSGGRGVYPTKYILARAVKLASGKTFPPEAKSGGQQTLAALRKIIGGDARFKIVSRKRGSP